MVIPAPMSGTIHPSLLRRLRVLLLTRALSFLESASCSGRFCEAGIRLLIYKREPQDSLAQIPINLSYLLEYAVHRNVFHR